MEAAGVVRMLRRGSCFWQKHITHLQRGGGLASFIEFGIGYCGSELKGWDFGFHADEFGIVVWRCGIWGLGADFKRGFGFRQTEAFGCQMIEGGQEEHNSDLLWGFSRLGDSGVKDSAFVVCFLCVMGHVGKNCTWPLLPPPLRLIMKG